MNHLKSIRTCSSKKVTWSIAELKCLHTNACNMGNKQEELEVIVELESYNLIAITETWRDESYDWSTVIDGYKLFRRDRQGERARAGSVPSIERIPD